MWVETTNSFLGRCFPGCEVEEEEKKDDVRTNGAADADVDVDDADEVAGAVCCGPSIAAPPVPAGDDVVVAMDDGSRAGAERLRTLTWL